MSINNEARDLAQSISQLGSHSALEEMRHLKGEALVKRYLEFLANCTLETVHSYQVHLMQFFEVIGTDDIGKVDGEAVADYIFHLKQENYAQDSIKLKIGRVMGFLRFCNDLNMLNFPLGLLSHLIKAPRVHTKELSSKDIFDLGDIEKLAMYFNTRISQATVENNLKAMRLAWRDRLIFTIGLNTGIRVSEISNIQIKDMIQYNGKWYIKIIGKGSKHFDVPLLGRDLTEVIKPYLQITKRTMGDRDSYLLMSDRSKGLKPLNRTAIFKVIKKVCLEAEIYKNLSPHSLRHTFATNLALQGADIHTVKEALHHESITTSERYIHMAQQLKDKIRNYIPGVVLNAQKGGEVYINCHAGYNL